MPMQRARAPSRAARAPARLTVDAGSVRVEARERDRREVVELGVPVARAPRARAASRRGPRSGRGSPPGGPGAPDQRLDVLLREELALELPHALEELATGPVRLLRHPSASAPRRVARSRRARASRKDALASPRRRAGRTRAGAAARPAAPSSIGDVVEGIAVAGSSGSSVVHARREVRAPPAEREHVPSVRLAIERTPNVSRERAGSRSATRKLVVEHEQRILDRRPARRRAKSRRPRSSLVASARRCRRRTAPAPRRRSGSPGSCTAGCAASTTLPCAVLHLALVDVDAVDRLGDQLLEVGTVDVRLDVADRPADVASGSGSGRARPSA